MAGKSNKFEYDFLRLIFNGVAITNICSTAGSTSLWLALLTADPGDGGSTANEGGYTAYTRVKTDRSSAASTGWAVTSGDPATVTPVTNVDLPQVATTSTGTFTHFGVYPSSNAEASSGLYFGTLSPNINFSQNVTPRITTGSSITED
jgi:hypothetical protein